MISRSTHRFSSKEKYFPGTTETILDFYAKNRKTYDLCRKFYGFLVDRNVNRFSILFRMEKIKEVQTGLTPSSILDNVLPHIKSFLLAIKTLCILRSSEKVRCRRSLTWFDTKLKTWRRVSRVLRVQMKRLCGELLKLPPPAHITIAKDGQALPQLVSSLRRVTRLLLATRLPCLLLLQPIPNSATSQ